MMNSLRHHNMAEGNMAKQNTYAREFLLEQSHSQDNSLTHCSDLDKNGPHYKNNL